MECQPSTLMVSREKSIELIIEPVRQLRYNVTTLPDSWTHPPFSKSCNYRIWKVARQCVIHICFRRLNTTRTPAITRPHPRRDLRCHVETRTTSTVTTRNCSRNRNRNRTRTPLSRTTHRPRTPTGSARRKPQRTRKTTRHNLRNVPKGASRRRNACLIRDRGDLAREVVAQSQALRPMAVEDRQRQPRGIHPPRRSRRNPSRPSDPSGATKRSPWRLSSQRKW